MGGKGGIERIVFKSNNNTKPMKPIAIAILMMATSFASETSRTWTDTKGRTLEGQLVAKTEFAAVILNKAGKRIDLKLETLSEPDRAYVEKADVSPAVRMLAKTVAVKRNTSGSQRDSRSVVVELSEVHGREFTARIVWIGDAGDKAKYGVAKTDTQTTSENGTLTFSHTFGTTVVFSRNYKGYAVELTDKDGAVVARQGSIAPLVRFLDNQPKQNETR